MMRRPPRLGDRRSGDQRQRLGTMTILEIALQLAEPTRAHGALRVLGSRGAWPVRVVQLGHVPGAGGPRQDRGLPQPRHDRIAELRPPGLRLIQRGDRREISPTRSAPTSTRSGSPGGRRTWAADRTTPRSRTSSIPTGGLFSGAWRRRPMSRRSSSAGGSAADGPPCGTCSCPTPPVPKRPGSTTRSWTRCQDAAAHVLMLLLRGPPVPSQQARTARRAPPRAGCVAAGSVSDANQIGSPKTTSTSPRGGPAFRSGSAASAPASRRRATTSA